MLHNIGICITAVGGLSGGLSKTVGHHGWPMKKNLKKTLAKTP